MSRWSRRILDELGYTDMLRADRSPEAEGRLENLKELTNALQEFDALPAFLEHVALLTDNAEQVRRRHGERHDPARRQGAGVRHRVPAGLGGRPVPQPARARRQGPGRARGGAPPRLCRPDPRAQAGLCLVRRQPARLQPVAGRRFRRASCKRAADRPARREQRRRPLRHLLGRPSRRPARPGERLRLREPRRHAQGRARTRWRDETIDDRRAVEGDKPDLSVGQRVFHQKFGYGRIVAVDGNKLDIEFEKAGPKKVLDSFIEAA